MKKFLPLMLALLAALMFSVSAEDARFVFAVSDDTVPVSDTAYVVVSVSEHDGITGLALNVTYDHEKVRFVSYDVHPALPEGLVSVYDNEFGQVRITYVPSHGMTYFFGSLVTLGFASLDGTECSSVVRVDEGIATVSDRNYLPCDYASLDGSVTFGTSFEESSETPSAETSSEEISQ